MKQAQAELRKLNQIGEPEFEEEKKEDTRSMLQVMQDKRKATEAQLAAAQKDEKPAGETMEERKARLAAQRDLLRKMKEEKRQKELSEHNAMLAGDNAGAKVSLAEEFKQIDANKQMPAGQNPELDRRRMIYKNIRKEISDADQAAK